ncbi:MAG: twin-arginine translocase TatA/TatE family subunit [Phascolarctobacterium sp.]
MFGLGLPELLLILVIGLVFFGPGKLPDVGKAIGKSMREFKTALNEVNPEVAKEVSAEVEKAK